ncbi:hypothetical protein PHMEG_00024644 [Phytophthora megakarya]|uniref:Uncharacterized protein n=1 Tax=Phytophthora megakarya TaxID=4795 RepID=A0A225VFN5_9STRA|nr:hypothetical protein PHMEG_00024644 [Phytophthora megakarya]
MAAGSDDNEQTRENEDERRESADSCQPPVDGSLLDGVSPPSDHGALTSARSCCWRSCKKVPKEGDGCIMCECSRDGCVRTVHAACASTMLVQFGAPRKFNSVPCGKRCFNALTKQPQTAPTQQKKRVPWHNDGPTAAVSSLSVLVDWMTDGNNYNRYRGGDSESGESKTTIAGEVISKIEAAGITTPRSAKDITNKISALESLFRSAEDWRHCSGQGREYNDPSIRDGLIQRCSLYFQLRDIMIDRASTHPSLLSTDSAARQEDTEDENDSSSDVTDSPRDSIGVTNAAAQPSTTLPVRPASTPISIAQRPTKRSRTSGESEQTPFIKMKKIQLAQQRDFQMQDLEIRKRTLELQEREAETRKQQYLDETRAIDARITEANAQAEKLRQEAEHWRQQRKIDLLRERNKLQQEGVAQDDIDALLPLSTYF